MLKGVTDVHADAGSVEIEAFTGIRGYTMELHADAGDIQVGEDEIDGNDFKQQGGSDVIKVRTDAGDIEIGEMTA